MSVAHPSTSLALVLSLVLIVASAGTTVAGDPPSPILEGKKLLNEGVNHGDMKKIAAARKHFETTLKKGQHLTLAHYYIALADYRRLTIQMGRNQTPPDVGKMVDKGIDHLEKSVEIASWIGAEIVNTALSGPARNSEVDTGPNGAPQSHGSSQMATADDYARTGKALKEIGDMAGDNGINITIEVHQHSIADNSWSTLHLLVHLDGDVRPFRIPKDQGGFAGRR